MNEIDVSGRLVEASSFDLPLPPVPPPLPPSAQPLLQVDARPAPSAPPNAPTSTSAGAGAGVSGQGAGQEQDESRAGRLGQLRQLLGGSETQLSRLAELDAAARGPGKVEAETEVAAAAVRPPPAEAADPAAAASSGDGVVGGSVSKTNSGGWGPDDVVRIPAGADKEARANVHRAVQETFPFIKVSCATPAAVLSGSGVAVGRGERRIQETSAVHARRETSVASYFLKKRRVVSNSGPGQIAQRTEPPLSALSVSRHAHPYVSAALVRRDHLPALLN